MARRYRFDDVQIDLQSFRLLKAEKVLPVEPKALNLLVFLVENRGRLVERRELLNAVWGEAFVTDHVLNRAIGQLRKLLEDNSKEPRYIETVPTRGYRFIAEVEEEPAPKEMAVAGPTPRQTSSLIQTHVVNEEGHASGSDLSGGAATSWKAEPPASAAKETFRPGRWAAGGMVLLLVLAASAAVLWKKTAEGSFSANAPIRSLAVLPLENLSGDGAQEYLADGMTAELITGLAQIRALRVISQTTAMQYKNVHKPLPQIAKELNVDAVIEGSVMRSNEQVRISAHLVDGLGDKQLWAGSYEGDLADVVGLENQVASAVAERMRIEVSPRERMQLAGTRPIDPRASEAFFKGGAALDINSLESERAALQFFQEAVRLDPQFARAYVGVAKGYNYLAGWGGFAMGNGIPVGEATAAADSAIAKALELDPGLGEAYEERAWTSLKFRWDFPSAEAGFRHALELEPGAVSAHDGLSVALMIQGRTDEALREVKLARDIDPLSLIINTDYCRILQYAHRDDLALQQCDATVRLGPTYNYAIFMTAQLHERKGDYAEGHRLWRTEMGGCDTYCLAMVDEIHGAPGVAGAFDAWLKRRKNPPEAFFLARAYAGLHRKDQAFEWLEKAYELHSDVYDMAFLELDPDFDSLHSDPRFDAFLRRIGLPLPPQKTATF